MKSPNEIPHTLIRLHEEKQPSFFSEFFEGILNGTLGRRHHKILYVDSCIDDGEARARQSKSISSSALCFRDEMDMRADYTYLMPCK